MLLLLKICLALLSLTVNTTQEFQELFQNFPSRVLYDITDNKHIILPDLCNNKEDSGKWKLPDILYIRTKNLTKDRVRSPWDVEDILQRMKTAIGADLSFALGIFVPKNLMCRLQYFRPVNFTHFSSDSVGSSTIIIQSQVRSQEYLKKEICATLCLSLIRGFHQYYDQIGIDVGQNVFECIESSCPFVLEKVGSLIYNIELEQISSMLSYGGFSRKLDVVKAFWENTWIPLNSGSFYVRTTLSTSQGFNTNTLAEVHGFVQKYVQMELFRWTQFPYVILEGSKTFKTFDPYVESVNQALLRDTTYPRIDLETFKNKNNSVCKLWHILKSTLPYFNTFFLQVENWDHVDIIGHNCVSPLNVSLNEQATIIVSGEANKSFVDHFKSMTSNMSLYIPSLLFLETKKLNIENKNVLEVISIEEVRNSPSHKSNFVNIPQVLLLNNTFLAQENLASVPSRLDDILKLRDRLEHRIGFRNATYLLEFIITDNSVWSLIPGDKTAYFKLNLYCLDILIKIRELHEALINWASIHQFKVSPFPLVDAYRNVGWCHAVSLTLGRSFKEFETITRGNTPKHPTMSAKNNMCIEPSVADALRVSAITYKYLQYKNHGVTLSLDEHLNYVALNETHLQNFLLISFIKFESVEVQVQKPALLHLLMNTFTNELRGKIAKKLNRNTTDIVLYLSLDATSISFTKPNIDKLLNFSPAGIHLFNWENISAFDTSAYENIRYLNGRLKSGFGIMIQDCLQEIESNLIRFQKHKLLQIAKYVVCPLKGFPMYFSHTKEKELQIFLDTQLYIREFFKFTRNKTTYFKIWLNGDCKFGNLDDSDGYSPFSNMLGELSDMYHLSHFVGDTFLNCSHWSISNYSDLLNSSVYTNTDGATRHPDVPFFENVPADESSLSSNLPLIISLPLVFLLTIVFISAVSYYYKRKAKNILSKHEIEVFRKGEEIEVTHETIGVPFVQVNVVKSLGFNKAFEISKNYIDMEHRIGAGYFGEVYKGTYKSTTTVAVKLPSTDCSKEAFKTMLTEVKILSYLGENGNILKFIGAYTKEIGVGIIYMVTEFCENGTLEQYTRKLAKRCDRSALLQKSQNTTLSSNRESLMVDDACGKLNSSYLSSSDCRSVYKSSYNNDASDRDSTSAKVSSVCAGYTTFDSVVKATLETRQGLADPFYFTDETANVDELCRFAKEIASGMDYISTRQVIHSDLSTRNVLLDLNNICKIADFGLSRKLYERPAYIKQGGEALPWRWMAIESLKNMEFTTKSDVWSYAVTLWEIFSLGDTPFSGVVWDPAFPEQLEEGLRLPKPKHAADKIFEKMKQCWRPSADERPTFSELKQFFVEFTALSNV